MAGAVFLLPITKLNITRGYTDYSELYDLLDEVDLTISVQQKATRFADRLAQLWNKLEIPTRLSALGLSAEDVDGLVDQYDDLKFAISQNPVPISKEDVRSILEEMK